MRIEFWGQLLEKLLIGNFHENTSVGSGVVLCRQTCRQTDLTKLTFAFRNSANAPNTTNTAWSIITV